MSKLEVSPELLEALQQLSALLESEDTLERTLETVVELSVAVFPGCDAAGVTLRLGGEDTTAAASDEFTVEIDKIQYGSNQGPCVSAVETSAIQALPVVAEDTRWPEFSRRAGERGLASVLSLPLRSGNTSGALNLYGKTERAFEGTVLDVAEVFAKQASVALQNAHTYQAARLLADQLNEAVKSRDLIGQAKGILMEREGITDAEAFDMLSTISQNTNVKVRDVAQRLVDSRVASKQHGSNKRT